MSGRWLVRGALAGVLGLQVAALVRVLHGPPLHHHTLWLQCVTLPLYAMAVVLLASAELAPRQAVGLVLGVAAVLYFVALTVQPLSSDDDYRYAWDAKVQLAGIDPYRYAPDAPQLAFLRDAFLFPDLPRCHWPLGDGACSAINRPDVHTVYPPVAQAAFTIVRLASFGGHGNHLPMQTAGALGALAIGLLIARRTRMAGRPVWQVAVWAWCPITVLELSNGAHVDWLAVLLGVLALDAGAARRPGLAGVLAGAATAVKLYPALLLPALMRRRPVLVLGSAVATVAASYLPHLLAVGGDVVGFFPGYLREESYSSGGRFLLLGAVLPSGLSTVAAVLVLAATAWWVLRRTDPDAPEHGAVVMVGVALLVTTPQYGWYAMLLLALVALTGAIEWLPVVVAPTLFYLVQGDFGLSTTVGRVLYGSALVATIAWWLARRYLGRGRVGPGAALSVAVDAGQSRAAARPGQPPRSAPAA